MTLKLFSTEDFAKPCHVFHIGTVFCHLIAGGAVRAPYWNVLLVSAEYARPIRCAADVRSPSLWLQLHSSSSSFLFPFFLSFRQKHHRPEPEQAICSGCEGGVGMADGSRPPSKAFCLRGHRGGTAMTFRYMPLMDSLLSNVLCWRDCRPNCQVVCVNDGNVLTLHDPDGAYKNFDLVSIATGKRVTSWRSAGHANFWTNGRWLFMEQYGLKDAILVAPLWQSHKQQEEIESKGGVTARAISSLPGATTYEQCFWFNKCVPDEAVVLETKKYKNSSLSVLEFRLLDIARTWSTGTFTQVTSITTSYATKVLSVLALTKKSGERCLVLLLGPIDPKEVSGKLVIQIEERTGSQTVLTCDTLGGECVDAINQTMEERDHRNRRVSNNYYVLKHYKVPAQPLFTDFSKAHDNLDRNAHYSHFGACRNAPKMDQRDHTHLMQNTEAYLPSGIHFPLGRGEKVRQGCPLSPLLFETLLTVFASQTQHRHDYDTIGVDLPAWMRFTPQRQ
ncbi:hypothetical protein Pelo_17564 [Pelomyxa schiedti]|nr:hypothetical protein Pelo_17564 [Pelomyxa schiedti]